jgi:hypothetical protein
MAFTGGRQSGGRLTQESLELGRQPLDGVEIGRIGRAALIVGLAVIAAAWSADGCFAPRTDNGRATLLTVRDSQCALHHGSRANPYHGGPQLDAEAQLVDATPHATG